MNSWFLSHTFKVFIGWQARVRCFEPFGTSGADLGGGGAIRAKAGADPGVASHPMVCVENEWLATPLGLSHIPVHLTVQALRPRVATPCTISHCKATPHPFLN